MVVLLTKHEKMTDKSYAEIGFLAKQLKLAVFEKREQNSFNQEERGLNLKLQSKTRTEMKAIISFLRETLWPPCFKAWVLLRI